MNETDDDAPLQVLTNGPNVNIKQVKCKTVTALNVKCKSQYSVCKMYSEADRETVYIWIICKHVNTYGSQV